jgi:putative salt-induced outer membrane protein
MILIPLVLGSGLAAAANLDDFAPLPSPSSLPLSTALQGDPVLVPATHPEGTDGWDGSFNVGASKSSGNTDVENYSVTFDAVKELDVNRYNLAGGWYYAATDNERSQRRAIGSFKYDRFFAEKTYFWGNAFAETNEEALVDLRWSAGAGLGHQFRDDDVWQINAEAGLAYFDEQFDDDTESEYLAARIAWKGSFVATETTTINHSGAIWPSLEEKDDVYALADTSADFKINASLLARIQWLFTWDNTPAAGQERVDNLYLLSLGWKF